MMRLMQIAVPFVFVVAGLGQALRLPNEWKNLGPEQLLARPDFYAIPYEGRRQVLSIVDPQFGRLPRAKQLDILWDFEKASSKEHKRRATNFLIWESGNTKYFDSILQNGEQILITYYGPLTLGTTVYRDKDYTVAWVYARLEADSKVRIDLVPERFKLAFVQPRVSLQQPKDADKIAASMVKKARGWAALLGGLSGMATTNRRTTSSGTVDGTYNGSAGYGTYSGTYSGTSSTIEPDYQARANGQQAAARIVENAQHRAGAIKVNLLRATTVMPGTQVNGLVYFPKGDAPGTAVLQIPVGTVAFEFPVAWRK